MTPFKWILFTTCLASITAISSCSYSKKDIVKPTCVLPNTVSYAVDIVPILNSNCYACHSAGSNLSGVLLDSYNTLRIQAQSGTLYGVINHNAGFSPMPDGGAKLNDCTIAIIKKWIDSGSPNN